jgi:predicted ATPase
MQSWRTYQLEPAALRQPDSFRDPARLGIDGKHLPATVQRLRLEAEKDGHGAEGFLAALANRLALLIDDVGSVEVERDETRELYSIRVTDRYGTSHSARSLSDGTLRFLALSTLEADPEFTGVLCLEEPENGIHPDRIPAMVSLLHDLAASTDEPVSDDNPLRQVIVNTHSPGVVGYVYDDELLLAETKYMAAGAARMPVVHFMWLPKTWRETAQPERRALSIGRLIAYLAPHNAPSDSAPRVTPHGPLRRVVDREDLGQLRLKLVGSSGG